MSYTIAAHVVTAILTLLSFALEARAEGVGSPTPDRDTGAIHYLGLDPDGRARISISGQILHVPTGDTVGGKWVVWGVNYEKLILEHRLSQAEKEALRVRGAVVYDAEKTTLEAPVTANPENKWGPFEGRVVDAESGEGIVGAAVIVFWKTDYPNPVERHQEYYDSRWAVSQSDGQFRIARYSPPLFRLFISGAYLGCVAPGYLPFQFRPQDNWRIESARLREGPLTLRMRRKPAALTHEEWLRLEGSGELAAENLSSIPEPRFKEIAGDINQLRAAMGLSPIRLMYGDLE